MATFTTLEKVRRWLNLSGTGDDALLTDLIPSASAFIEQYISRSLLSASYTAVRNGNGHYRMVLPQYPITAVASVSVDGVSIPAAVAATDQGWLIEHQGARNIVLRGYRFTEGIQNVQIAYTAGYAEVPADIEDACTRLVGLIYKQRDRIGQVSKQLAGEVVTFSQKDMPDDIRTLLADYINVVPE